MQRVDIEEVAGGGGRAAIGVAGAAGVAGGMVKIAGEGPCSAVLCWGVVIDLVMTLGAGKLITSGECSGRNGVIFLRKRRWRWVTFLTPSTRTV